MKEAKIAAPSENRVGSLAHLSVGSVRCTHTSCQQNNENAVRAGRSGHHAACSSIVCLMHVTPLYGFSGKAALYLWKKRVWSPSEWLLQDMYIVHASLSRTSLSIFCCFRDRVGGC
jgi:hypothetical protein